ncbi:TetR/AcrR family transcriptional regulator [Methyloraptor flagellatus]|uniref:TetR/AcrR family transcriptional regulator n=1 Tax=Methyloraptor flagellatus TaxID=3162530 RepID=A0AAU7X8S3_9HYPH
MTTDSVPGPSVPGPSASDPGASGPGPRPPIEAARGATRRRLVEAAAALFWADGYTATSIAAVAAEAAVPAGNVFYHFKAKADLARAVVDLFASETAASLARIDRRQPKPLDRLAAFAALLADAVQSRVARGCPIARGTTEFPAACEPARPFTIMADWLAAVLVATGVGPEAARAVALSALARWQGAIVLAHATADETLLAREIEAVGQVLRTAAVGALGAKT